MSNISIIFISFILILPFVCSIHFKITSFNQSSQIAYQGDAKPKKSVDLTHINFTCRAGWVTYGKEIPLWDPAIGKPSDFTTRFSFRIDTKRQKYGNYGQGFAFFIAPARIKMPPNSAGGFLGLFNQTHLKSSPYPLVHVEFDTFSNPEWDPTDMKSHVGINNNSLVSANVTSWNATLHSKDVARVVIFYDSVRRNLSVSWSYNKTSDPNESSSLSYIIDLSKVLPPEVTMGFSASSGSFSEGNRLLSWKYSSKLEPRDLKKIETDRKVMIIGSSVAGFVLLTFVVISLTVFLRRKQRKKRAEEEASLISINDDLERGAGPKKFSYKDLVTAANNFSDDRKLGEGGFGAVYKGYLTGRVGAEGSLVERVWEFYGKGDVMEVVDEKLRVDGFDEKEAECLMVVGLWCAHPDRNERPSIKQAIQVLNLEAPLPRLPNKMPVATYHVSSSSNGTSVSSGGDHNCYVSSSSGTVTFSSAQVGR
ncbi:unnamed protein product [Eruca vesicaria subsp. sativa]|uniref:Legume lectin domain-containing protein n=1 Tax=Eruca vesicaria subsp. sativa TaxID=29727 RepID=A0ABC8IUW8_ERUVS|nr:unnamed protein product [Eruca vesicaria subsp. sativa]